MATEDETLERVAQAILDHRSHRSFRGSEWARGLAREILAAHKPGDRLLDGLMVVRKEPTAMTLAKAAGNQPHNKLLVKACFKAVLAAQEEEG